MTTRTHVLALAWLVAVAASAPAHETDQYTLPVGREFADMRAHYSRDVLDKLQVAVDQTNARIRDSLREGRATAETLRRQSPDAIERALYARFPSVINHVETLEFGLRGAGVRAEYPGLVVAHMPWIWIYHHPALIIDPTKLVRLGRCSTVMIDGVLLGNDKYVHFVHMGHIYYRKYRDELAAGKTPQEATAACIALGTGGNLFLSEGTLLGMITTGVWSNADLAADYAGLKFFLNLTEEVRVRGEPKPPILERDGHYWRIPDRVRVDSDFFTAFVSDHWNEALNPNTYQFGMDNFVRDAVRPLCDEVVAWYVDRRGRSRPKEAFLKIARELSTYYGEPYGYRGEPDQLVSIATACFPAGSDGPPGGGLVPGGAADPGPRVPVSGMMNPYAEEIGAPRPDALGRTELWWAAREGDAQQVAWLLGHGADLTIADLDGYTPLHAAVMSRSESAVEALLAAGADPTSTTSHGAPPLLLAVRGGLHGIARQLLDRRAPVDEQDAFGCTPLHDAAARDDRSMALLLLAGGASATARDRQGTTPLHRAARSGADEMVRLLLQHGADPRIMNDLGHRADDEARAGRHRAAARALAAAR